MTTDNGQVAGAHHAFGQVAALFDSCGAQYGQRPSPRLTGGWLHDQLTLHRITIAAALNDGQACGLITTSVMPASLMLGTAWSIRDLYVIPQRRRAGILVLAHRAPYVERISVARVGVADKRDRDGICDCTRRRRHFIK